ncbi:MAG: asparagine synthase [Clostridia bacterium]|nr:asparagine synthase [Clostridia bacterium]
MELEKSFINVVNNRMPENQEYTCVVMFSGGKDSTYLADVMKKYAGGKVCLLNVDNGYENSTYTKHVAEKLKLPLFTYQPPKEEMTLFYNYLLSTPELKQIDNNPLCFICNRYFTSVGIEFAGKYKIPFVVSALTSAQIFGSKVEMTDKLINVSNWVMKDKLNRSHELIRQTKIYNENEKLKGFIDKVFYENKNVDILYPFLYFDYDITKIIDVLEKKYGWVNPVEGISNKRYVTSGCTLTKLFGLCEKKLGFHIHELTELSIQLDNGSLSKEKFDSGVKWVEENLSEEITDEKRDIINELGLQEIFLS